MVSGEFTGAINEVIAVSAVTDSNGMTSISSSGSAKGSVNITFCVTGIVHPSLLDFSASPGAVCSSN